MAEIDVMRASLDRGSARSLVSGLTGDDAEIERRVFYPYFRFGVSGLLRWLFGRRRLRTNCLVDARTGRASTSDRLVLELLTVTDDERLRPVQAHDAAARQAHRYATHALGRSLRVLGDLDIELDEGGLVHRPFWIVRSGRVRVLVDAVSGELHPLRAAGASQCATRVASAIAP
jgi:hypothetical protein